MQRLLKFLILVCLSLTYDQAMGDRGRYDSNPAKYFSESGIYCLQITPSQEGEPGNCKAELYKTGTLIKEIMWTRYLINNLRPGKVWISDNGKRVVTFDDYFTGGFLPVVVYGEKGELIKIHSLDSLGMYKPENRTHLRDTVEFGIPWAENAYIFGSPDNKVLYLGLSWGNILMIDLSDGAVMDKKWLDLKISMNSITLSHYNELQEYGEKEIIKRNKTLDLKKKD